MSTPAIPHTPHSSVAAPTNILDPGLCLTLRPMRFPIFYDMFRDGIKNKKPKAAKKPVADKKGDKKAAAAKHRLSV